MASIIPNTFIQSLAERCRQNRTGEKWLLAPSLRVGRQWLDTVVLTGQPVLNVHVKTLGGLALQLARPEVARRGLTLLRGMGPEIIIDRIWSGLHSPGAGYLFSLPPSPSLSAAITRAVTDLRRAGLSRKDLESADLETPVKRRELLIVLDQYEQVLQQRGYVDEADIVRLAMAFLHDQSGGGVDRPVEWLIPEDLEPTPLQARLIELVPPDRRVVLAIDRPATPESPSPSGPLTGRERLRWIQNPAEAPESDGEDDSVRLFDAVGEINEAREVFRRIQAEGLPLNQVEILYTDPQTYLPLLYEIAARRAIDAREGQSAPLRLTWADGIPCRYSRPGRALTVWLRWAREGCPETLAVALIADGLVEVGADGDDAIPFATLAEILGALGIGRGRGRYDRCLERAMERLSRSVDPSEDADEDTAAVGDAESDRRRLAALQVLRGWFAELLAITPDRGTKPLDLLEMAEAFLNRFVRRADELDNYARERLVLEIDTIRQWMAPDETDASLDIRDWLSQLPRRINVLGRAPQPGHAHVASLDAGGHSGRPWTFILGLDDSRFPGGARQDPILLDTERHRISKALDTGADAVGRRLQAMARLLARLRGVVTLSYSSRSIADDREQFPSALFINAFRLISGRRDADQSHLRQWLPTTASFAPDHPDKALNTGEWILARGLASEPPADLSAIIAARYPHLVQGARAEAARDSEAFTVYDGWVPEAGALLDPTAPQAPPVSGSGLEDLAACPLRFFFQRGLGIQPPRERILDPRHWLEPGEFGALIHEIFRDFIQSMMDADLWPVQVERDTARMGAIRDGAIERIRQRIPPPNEATFAVRRREIEQITHIFLVEEERYQTQTGARPAFVEASLGLDPAAVARLDDDLGASVHRTALDTPQPVPVHLGEDLIIRTRGRVDRIDQATIEWEDGETRGFVIWDYKTGRTSRYDTKEAPFNQGRVIQNALYLAMTRHHLKQRGDDRPVLRFGYFFPGLRARGERIDWDGEMLMDEGLPILRALCRTVANGAFLATPAVEDCRYCDYRPICGEVDRVTAGALRKLQSEDRPPALDPFAQLRNIQRE